MPNFLTMPLDEIDAFLASRQWELDMHGVQHGELKTRVGAGKSALEQRDFGFAVVNLQPMPDGMFRPHLWAIYVNPEDRGRKQGHKFMREILAKYSADYHMSVTCHGPRRRAFFGRLGFIVKSRDGEYRMMTTNKDDR